MGFGIFPPGSPFHFQQPASGGTSPGEPAAPLFGAGENRSGPFINRVPQVTERERRFFDLLSGWFNCFVRRGFIIQGRKADDWMPFVGGFQAARDPGVDDDTASIGAYPGASWVNTETLSIWFMRRGTTGTAVWEEAGGGGSGGAVDSVNGQTGTVVLDAGDVGADASGTAAAAVSAHEADTTGVHGIADTANLLTTSTKLDDLAAPDDNTDLNASTSAHGLLRKLDNDTTHFLRGDGSWAAIPAGGGTGGATEAYARRAPHYPPFTVTGNDDEFDDGSFSGWTAVQDSSPTLTLTESNDCLSIYHPGGDSAAELHAWVKAQSFASNDWVETCLRVTGIQVHYRIAGLIFADGTTYGAGTQVGFYYSPSEQRWIRTPHTNYNTTGGITVVNYQNNSIHGDMFLRFKYEGSNNWRGYASPDGISWLDITGSFARTLTPTHAGFFVSTWGGALPFVASLRYVRFGNG